MKYLFGILALVGFFYGGILADRYYEHNYQRPIAIVYIEGLQGENGVLLILPDSKPVYQHNVEIGMVQGLVKYSQYGAFVVRYNCAQSEDGTSIDMPDRSQYRVF